MSDAFLQLATRFPGDQANQDESRRDHLNLANSAFQVLFDVIILALPIPIIVKTKFKRRDRGNQYASGVIEAKLLMTY